MSGSRHRAARRRSPIRKVVPVAAAVAVVAAGATVTLQLAGGEHDSLAAQSGGTTYSSRDASREESSGDGEVSRSEQRDSLPDPSQHPAHDQGAGTATVAAPEPAGKKFVTTELNVRTGPGEQYDVLTTLPTGSKVTVTDRTEGPWAEVIYRDEARWVTAEYLSEKKPEETGGITDAPCPSGSDVESGLMPDAILVHRTVCAEFPEVTTYGGLRPGDDGEHGTGQALDIMIPSSTVGDEIADFVRAHASELGVSEVLWSQHIWTVERSSEGWRPMEDRGSDTANHYDHVHVTVYGDSAG